MEINNGTDVNPLWENSIVYSANGADWEHIDKNAVTKISKSYHTVSGKAKDWNKRRDSRCKVVIEGSNNTILLSFDAQDISNQATWNDGTQSELATAVEDIMSWL